MKLYKNKLFGNVMEMKYINITINVCNCES